jgi:O-methyltransferase involved in polyketide biosynthesis
VTLDWYAAAMTVTRDFSTISPSAHGLLVMRAQTGLPFARKAAELLMGADGFAAEIVRLSSIAGADLRRRHFEERYRSIDALLADSGATRVLELAGGLSFRGLALALAQPVAYVDTDLPAMAENKAKIVSALDAGPLIGELRIRPLNALDADGFRAAVDELPPGSIAIVNEGLLMYLDPDEKRKLAGNIRDALVARGGVWITGDIYLQAARDPRIGQDDRLRDFLAAHRVEEQKFENRAAAEAFLVEAGFTVQRRLARSDDAIRESWVVAPR